MNIPSPPDPELGLYVHLPFCPHRCPYCDFPAQVWRQDLAGPLMAAILDQLQAVAPQARGRQLTSLYLGGGTPSMWPARALAGLIQAIRTRVGIAPGSEVTMEANPGGLSPKKLEALVRAGVNRISLGVQSMDPGLLAALGRRHGPEQAARAVAWARQAGFASVSLDIIYGLPGQTVEGLLDELDQALKLAPDHLSLYELTLAPDTPFGQRFHPGVRPLPLEGEVMAMEQRGRALLEQAGLTRYEVSNFAWPGHQCRHNLSTWAGGDYLALGPGAHGHMGGVRWAWVNDPVLFLQEMKAGREPLAFREDLTPHQRGLELVMLGLRTIKGVDLAQAGLVMGLPVDQAWPQALSLVEELGWAQRRGARLVPTPIGLDMADAAAALFA